MTHRLPVAFVGRSFNHRRAPPTCTGHRRRTAGLHERLAAAGRILLGVILVPIRVFWLLLFPAVATVFWRQFVSLSQNSIIWTLAAGFVAGVALDRLWYRHQELLKVTIHELTHVLVGILFCCVPIGFKSTRDRGGYARGIGVGLLPFVGLDCMTLAPYFLSTLAAPFIALHPVTSGPLKLLAALGAGIGFGVHAIGNIEEFLGQSRVRGRMLHFGRESVSDIERSGRFFSLLFIPLMWLATNGLAFAILLGGYAGAVVWAGQVWQIASPTLKAVGAFFAALFS